MPMTLLSLNFGSLLVSRPGFTEFGTETTVLTLLLSLNLSSYISLEVETKDLMMI